MADVSFSRISHKGEKSDKVSVKEICKYALVNDRLNDPKIGPVSKVKTRSERRKVSVLF